ncbi:hypothetical protein CRG98_024712 [Punica granatum]|uniref:Uncharacterized protein n=1 Tax=Punica granatum TaxID=22663 RepID=A0A2I0JF49_PUNGR|nr:hypothetical protein CRG98_024712 [Punica granatum]
MESAEDILKYLKKLYGANNMIARYEMLKEVFFVEMLKETVDGTHEQNMIRLTEQFEKLEFHYEEDALVLMLMQWTLEEELSSATHFGKVEQGKEKLGSEMARSGYSYFITFTDDYSRYRYVYLLKYKHESFEKFKEFKFEVEKQTGKSIKLLDPIDELNEVSERRNRTLLDMVQSMMSYADLPILMWGYALQTAWVTRPLASYLNLHENVQRLFAHGNDATTYEEAISYMDSSRGLEAMKSEMDSMSKN